MSMTKNFTHTCYCKEQLGLLLQKLCTGAMSVHSASIRHQLQILYELCANIAQFMVFDNLFFSEIVNDGVIKPHLTLKGSPTSLTC